MFDTRVLSLGPTIRDAGRSGLYKGILGGATFTPFFVTLVGFGGGQLIRLTKRDTEFTDQVLCSDVGIIVPMRLGTL